MSESQYKAPYDSDRPGFDDFGDVIALAPPPAVHPYQALLENLEDCGADFSKCPRALDAIEDFIETLLPRLAVMGTRIWLETLPANKFCATLRDAAFPTANLAETARRLGITRQTHEQNVKRMRFWLTQGTDIAPLV